MMDGSGGNSMWIWFILILVGLLLLGYVAVRVGGPGRSNSGPSVPERRTARQILDERYANGEIDEQEYRKRREALQ